MNELAKAVEYVNTVMSRMENAPSPNWIRDRVTRLFDEGVSFKQIVDGLLARQHVRDDEKALGLRKTNALDMTDLDAVEQALGINELTEVNRALWAEKFHSGQASYWCPKCGYAGNKEFEMPLYHFNVAGSSWGNGGLYRCYLCNEFFDDERYFTRAWTPEEQAAHEAERREYFAAQAAKRVEAEEFRKARAAQTSTFQERARAIAKAIDAWLWVEMGDDPESYEWDEASMQWMVTSLKQLLTAALDCEVAVKAQDVIAFFKANLKPPYDPQFIESEFQRAAALYIAQLKGEENHD